MEVVLIPSNKLISVDGLCHAVHNVHEPGYVFTGHIHNSWELVYVKKGQAVASADEDIFILKEGQLLFHKPLQFHEIQTYGSENVELLIIEILISGSAAERFSKKCYNLTSNEFKDYFEAFINLAEAGNHNYSKLYDARDLYASKAIAELENFLLNLLDKTPANRRRTYEEEEYYKRIASVMFTNCEKKLSVDDIAKLCNMSRSNLKRIFSKYNNVGIAKYLLTLKIKRAAEMLSDGCSSKEITEKLNFSSSHYFQTAFKREIGITPNEYRKMSK